MTDVDGQQLVFVSRRRPNSHHAFCTIIYCTSGMINCILCVDPKIRSTFLLNRVREELNMSGLQEAQDNPSHYHKSKKKGNPAFIKGQMPPIGRPWKKGQTGNPKGTNKKARLISSILDDISVEELINDPMIPQSIRGKIGKIDPNITKQEALYRLVYAFAMAGQAWAVEFIADRTEGKPKERIDLFNHDVEIDIEGEVSPEDADKVDDIGTQPNLE